MRRKTLYIITAMFFAMLLSGCYGAQESEDVAYITALAIDKTENEKLKFTYRIAVPRAAGTSKGVGQELPDGTSVLSSFVAPSHFEARNLLASSLSRHSNLSHVKAIIISEDLARSGISDIIAPFTRYREYRGSVFILIARGSAENLLQKNMPKIDYLHAKYIESMVLKADESNYYVRSDVHEVYLGLKNPGRSAYATYVAVNPLTGQDEPFGQKLQSSKAHSYIAGDMPRTGTADLVELAGIAIFSGDRMVGILGTRETRILSILQGKLRDDRLIADDPLEPRRTIQMLMRNGSKPDVTVDLVNGREVIKIKVFLEGELMSNPSGINYEKGEYRELLEAQISNLVKEEIDSFINQTQELGSDVYGFGRYLRGRFKTYQELETLNFEQLYKTASIEVEVTTKLRRSGLMWRTSPTKPGAAPK